MPHLFVANTLEQDQTIWYRTEFDTPTMPEWQRNRPARTQEIKAGRQEALGGENWSDEICTQIIRQIVPYGAIEIGEIKNGHAKISMVFNVGSPVPISAIQDAMSVNKGILIEEGRLRRSRAAVAINKTVEDAAALEMIRHNFDPAEAPMKGFAVELEQQDEVGPAGRLEEGHGQGTLDPRGPGAPPISPQPAKRGPGRPRRAA